MVSICDANRRVVAKKKGTCDGDGASKEIFMVEVRNVLCYFVSNLVVFSKGSCRFHLFSILT